MLWELFFFSLQFYSEKQNSMFIWNSVISKLLLQNHKIPDVSNDKALHPTYLGTVNKKYWKKQATSSWTSDAFNGLKIYIQLSSGLFIGSF